MKYIADKKRYEIEDEDAGDDGVSRKRYKLNKKHIVALPKTQIPTNVFPRGSNVLAMFPNTTTFYPAVVDREASKVNNYMYSLKFEDDEEGGKLVSRKVSFKHVIPSQKG